MGHAPSIDAKISSQISAQTTSQRTSKDHSPSRERTSKSLITHIIEALHHARRLQAKRNLHQYRHLLGTPAQRAVREPHASSGHRRHGIE
ncbi:hypothetical protein [Bradyrhizobium sp.]|uniref:hypothetical protein n=1 Tax=Bradyrhizobium sp. TaxID=376 RepID=UPI001EBC78AA|nr:hypothetical protein [Bradyrhizobium sp.]MBV8921480.1 hypothetical protein [Bradyrhizobium sp.]MBV9981988.1 hypothetical protein [Bradyrhizobium sp.]